MDTQQSERDVFEGKGIDAEALKGCHEAAQHRSSATAVIPAKEHSVVATDSDVANHALDNVIVDRQIPVHTEAVSAVQLFME